MKVENLREKSQLFGVWGKTMCIFLHANIFLGVKGTHQKNNAYFMVSHGVIFSCSFGIYMPWSGEKNGKPPKNCPLWPTHLEHRLWAILDFPVGIMKGHEKCILIGVQPSDKAKKSWTEASNNLKTPLPWLKRASVQQECCCDPISSLDL